MTNSWKTRLQHLIDERYSGNKKAASLAVGFNETYFRDVLSRGQVPSSERMQRIANHFGRSVEWIMRDEPSVISIEDAERVTTGPVDLQAYEGGGYYRPRLAGAAPEIDAEAGAGQGVVGDVVPIHSGGIVSGHRVTQEWVIPKSELGADPQQVVVLPVRGTSMLPALAPGDRVMVDTQTTSIKAGEIYMLDEGDGPIVKRLRVVRDEEPIQIEIISENPSVAPYRRPHDRVRVIGQVIGRWSRLR
jgi:SOS-response transcriptional repressor LexA